MYSVFKIKVLQRAHAGCMGSQNCAPIDLFMCYFLYKAINILEKAQVNILCTCQPNCELRVQSAPLISNTVITF